MIFACRSFSPPKQPVQPARRIPARLSSHHVSTTGHAAHPSFPLRCSARPSRPLLGPAFVRFLGCATAAHPAAGKCLSFQSSNFAEVAFGTRDLTQNRSMNSYEIALQLRNSGLYERMALATPTRFVARSRTRSQSFLGCASPPLSQVICNRTKNDQDIHCGLLRGCRDR